MSVLRGKAATIVKQEVGYVSNPDHLKCGNCSYLSFEREYHNSKIVSAYTDKALKCETNHIAVGKHGICNRHLKGEPTMLEIKGFV